MTNPLTNKENDTMPSLSTLASAAAASSSNTSYETSGGRLVCTDGRVLPLKGASLTADAKGGIIRVKLEQTFANTYAEALRVTYTLPLPADGAVSGFAFRIGDKRIVGQVDTKKQARQRFEDAIIEGRTAAILDQERSSLFTQEVGNIPPRAEVVCEIVIDQKLTWLPDGFWEWRFPTVVAPRYLGEAGRVADHAKVTVDVADALLPVKLSLSMSIRDQLQEGVRPESPSHALHTTRGLQRMDVTFGDDRGVGLDRDVVVRWKAAGLKVGTSVDTVRCSLDRAFGLVTMVPPSLEAKMAALPRDLIVLLDTSGSMSGLPLDQARRVTSALIDTLGDDDQLELIEFSNSPSRWKAGSVPATAANRHDAQTWLAGLSASGGTEMRSGILEALRGIRNGAQRQVVLITDGLIGSEHEVLSAIAHNLPAASRVHTIGVGSGVNRSLTAPAARAGRGVEFIVGLGEDAEVGVKRLLARTSQPLVTDVTITGSAVLEVSPQRLPDVYSGSPAMMSVRLDPRGGELVVRGNTAFGPLEERVTVPALDLGQGSSAIATFFGRELVEDLEQNRVIEREDHSFDVRIERAGLEFQISTRLTSWVAVSDMQTVDPRAPRRTENQPQSPVYGMSAEGAGLRKTKQPMAAKAMLVGAAAPKRSAMRGMRSSAKDEAPPSPKALEMEPEYAGRQAEPVVADTEDMDDTADVNQSLSRSESAREVSSGSRAAPPSTPAPTGAWKAPEGGAGAEKKQKASSFIDMAKRALGFGSSEEEAAPEPSAVRQLIGLLVRLADGRLIATVTVDTAWLTWAPEQNVRVELADGTLVAAVVDATLTTASGTYASGVTVTLALRVPVGLTAPTKIHLVIGQENVEISL